MRRVSGNVGRFGQRLVNTRSLHDRKSSTKFYDLLLEQPVLPNAHLNKDQQGDDRKIRFSSRMDTPPSVQKSKQEWIELADGIRIPAKPEPPDNCCMSGCMKCVWVLYQQEVDEWMAAIENAKHQLDALEKPDHPGTLKSRQLLSRQEDTAASIDPGIRAFVTLERSLEWKRARRLENN
ncbi:UPF0651 protein, mitochondrial [Neolecta irregularis DAH-3]|uniref:UPF0651 protein, mitochondrial n=1 Tax=Neolecta irregularis (strain DAH-3) TaxID=1198029 RepID=A0A1U7LNN2_NEOID|nr:UPF0651 protein, mitochondrial [Neolecta irregularis DAH-3]|eukprot:OLL24238.1 UPF0651 protein, mitochondrial [Neolecta irregularis DAH-3]